MRRVLLDTQAFLFFVFDDPRLSKKAASLIELEEIEKILSIVSVWEIVIKVQLKKLHLGMSMEKFIRDFIEGQKLTLLEIELAHLLQYSTLPLLHRDPFDRLIISQAISLQVPIVTSDNRFSAYETELYW